jgi:hypothetical protein
MEIETAKQINGYDYDDEDDCDGGGGGGIILYL